MHSRTQPHQQHQQQQPTAGTSGSQVAATAAAATPAAAAADAAEGPAPELADEVSVEQLIVGVMLFTPLLGLLPTTVAWYLSAACLYACLHLLRLLLVAVGSWMQLRPLHVCADRWRQPQRFPGQLMLLPLLPTSSRAGAAAAVAAMQAVQGPNAAAGVGDGVAGDDDGVGDGGGSGGQQVPVSHYQLFYEPLSYSDVLAQSIAQQQGLLWYACQGGGSSSRVAAGQGGGGAGGVGWVVGWVAGVAVGRVWGLHLLSTHWQLL